MDSEKKKTGKTTKIVISIFSVLLLLVIAIVTLGSCYINDKLAKINYPQQIEFAMERTALYNEMTAYFPYNEINPSNQSGFVQVSMYFEVDRLRAAE